ncbi:DUF2922 domain-containing protein [Lysinibacillus telephonicus]|uniref:DUF2922 domain-containing protein n=1 Tax=Lysinibacillus telephonicus TaxID=1714840 RepID=A0A431UWS4_9BACI|nr:DUF2922 domain-containing protein [Lysinibacillus telephonicus]RTQ96038.1 DUF2922 domain-containing protein [Lysinibacillus telephonicus]
MSQVLELKFNTANGKTMTISVNDPKQNLTASEIVTAMQTIISEDVFHNEGHGLVAINEARIVDRNVSEIDLSQS